jgi:hypothetical protein
MPVNSRVFPALSYHSCKVSGLILKSLIHFDLLLVLHKIMEVQLGACRKPAFPEKLVEEALFYLLYMF